MPTACSAFGCTYRHRKGDNIGMYCFPKDENLRKLWTIAVRRSNWNPSPTSRICGKHFQSGKPSKDINHPDYVPNVFIFNDKNSTPQWKKDAEKKAAQRVAELFPSTSLDVTGLRWLKPRTEGNGTPLIPPKAKKKIVRRQPTKHDVPSCHVSKNMKENDNTGKRKAVEVSNNDGRFLMHREIRPALPQQRVWILNFVPAKKNPDITTEEPKEATNETLSFASVCGNTLAPLSDSSVMPYKDAPSHYAELMSDDSTLTAESSIPDTEDAVFFDNQLSIAANKDSAVCKVDSFVADSKNAESPNVDIIAKVTKDTLDNIPISTINPIPEENAEYDYSDFKSSPFDTKEDLAIKLETMLAVNISLQGKIKFYRNKCKKYEKEIINLTNTVKKIKISNYVP